MATVSRYESGRRRLPPVMDSTAFMYLAQLRGSAAPALLLHHLLFTSTRWLKRIRLSLVFGEELGHASRNSWRTSKRGRPSLSELFITRGHEKQCVECTLVQQVKN